MGHDDGQPPGFPSSLCQSCARMRAVRTSHSTFLRCTSPELPRYPRQPVLRCAAYEASAGTVAPRPFPGTD